MTHLRTRISWTPPLLTWLSVLLLVLAPGCQQDKQDAGQAPTPDGVAGAPVATSLTSHPATPEAQHSDKGGWQLFAWQQDGKWQFSLLLATNRVLSDDEISDPQYRLRSVAAVKEKLANLAPGEWVFLGPRERDGELPPEQTLAELRAFCEERRLVCVVSRQDRADAALTGTVYRHHIV